SRGSASCFSKQRRPANRSSAATAAACPKRSSATSRGCSSTARTSPRWPPRLPISPRRRSGATGSVWPGGCARTAASAGNGRRSRSATSSIASRLTSDSFRPPMLRTLLVLSILVPGFFLALKDRFNALLLYLWYAFFRPQDWMYLDISALKPSLVLG